MRSTLAFAINALLCSTSAMAMAPPLIGSVPKAKPAPMAPAAPKAPMAPTASPMLTQALPALNQDESVNGPDGNANGVRDDLDVYVNGLPFDDGQKSAMRQLSAALEQAMKIDLQNADAKALASTAIANAAACLHAKFPTAQSSQMSRDVQHFTVNTPNRIAAYRKFDAAMGGSTFKLPKGDGCKPS